MPTHYDGYDLVSLAKLKSDAELLKLVAGMIGKWCIGPGVTQPHWQLTVAPINVAQEIVAALRSRLTAETGVRDGAIEEAAKYHDAEAGKLRLLAQWRRGLMEAMEHHDESAVAIRALKSPPAPKGE